MQLFKNRELMPPGLRVNFLVANRIEEILPKLRDAARGVAEADKAMAVVCAGQSCLPPTSDPAQLWRRRFDHADDVGCPYTQDRMIQGLTRPYTAKHKKQADERQSDQDGQDNRQNET